MRNKKIYQMNIASLLIALGILIPMFSPLKILLEPASFTLASHVPLMIGMFLSPPITLAVSVGTTLGFLMGGFPISVVFRAASQIIFALLGAFWFQKHPSFLSSTKKFYLAVTVLSLIHAAGEILVVLPLYAFNSNALVYNVFVLVGIGTFLHSMVDFSLARIVFKSLRFRKD